MRAVTRASIIVCTRNRSAALDACLASLHEASIPGTEIVVVDNGSSDDTPDVVASRSAEFARLRYVTEPEPGLSRARNTGIAAAAGEVLVFVDDDVTVTAAWLPALLGAFDRWPEADGIAGRVRLSLAGPRPGWLHERLETWFSAFDKGDEPRLLGDGEFPFGANMAVRSGAARAVGGFAVDLGFEGRRLLGNEELDFFARVRSGGGALAYEPAAEVLHHIESARLSRRWLLRRVYAQGRADARLQHRRGLERAAMARAGARSVTGALLRGWRADTRRWRQSDNRAAELVSSVARRTKSLGYARETLPGVWR